MKLKLFEIMQQVEYIDINKVHDILEHKTAIQDWAYVLHDKDVLEDGSLKKPHYHIAVRLKDSYDTKYVSQWFDIKENYISKVKGKWADMLKYLTHANAESKFQYSKDSVQSNFDWQDVVAKAEKLKRGEARKNEIIEHIVSGEIREYNYTEHITAIENDKYKRSIDNAFKYRLDVIKGESRNMNAIFINGISGSGKTTYAKMLAEQKGYSYYVSSGSNDVLDDYKGQDCVILDDLRPSSLGLSDLLKMLDNHTASTIKSRYKNKVLECKLIIITTVLDIDTFFNNVFENEEEPIKQLKRRCQLYITLEIESMSARLYDQRIGDYGPGIISDNPVYGMFEDANMTDVDSAEKIIDMLGLDPNRVTIVSEEVGDFVELDSQTIIPFDKE